MELHKESVGLSEAAGEHMETGAEDSMGKRGIDFRINTEASPAQLLGGRLLCILAGTGVPGKKKFPGDCWFPQLLRE